jgi:hypothetical protein
MVNNINLHFQRSETPQSCGIYDQNSLLGLIESAFVAARPSILTHTPGGIKMLLSCAWDSGGDDVKLNKSRIFCDSYHYRDRRRKLSERLSSVGSHFSTVHGQTLTQHISGPIIIVSLFDINGVGVDDYVKSILNNPDAWLDALLTVD